MSADTQSDIPMASSEPQDSPVMVFWVDGSGKVFSYPSGVQPDMQLRPMTVAEVHAHLNPPYVAWTDGTEIRWLAGSTMNLPGWRLAEEAEIPALELASALADAIAKAASLRSLADAAIGPLQDAVDYGEATESEESALKKWKMFRLSVRRVVDQPGYPTTIEWPEAPE